ncbi:MAG: hypothetical protein Q7J54_06445 [Candidatus Woesearchaeota archaeon]|nr:hypothetical protein [Candidatus Woesearchaeota archaeon]
MGSDEQVKEVFAQFGRAYYLSECLHRGLCLCYASAPFKDKKHVTRPYYEERLAYAFSLTLGQIIKNLEEILPKELYLAIENSSEKRNYLAHKFWYERCHLFFTSAGVDELLGELNSLSDLFEKLDENIVEYYKPVMEILGVDETIIDNAFKNIISGAKDEPLPISRNIRKFEKIVNSWEVPVADKGKSIVFQTDDGLLLQLCADGLGWSCYKKPDNDWLILEKVQKHLPANVETRPKKENPWDYEMKFSTGICIWVKYGSKDKTFRWGIRLKKA